jgi:hypothetical protein
MAKLFTALELTLIENLFHSSDWNGHDFGIIEDSVEESGIDPKVARGVLSSLVKKEVITIWEAVTNDSGTFTQFTWRGKNAEDITCLEDIVNQ